MHQTIDSYFQPLPLDDYNQYKMLRKGYALLAYYLNDEPLMEKFWYDKLLTGTDKGNLQKKGWTIEQEDLAINSLCNTIAIKIPVRRKGMDDKFSYYRRNELSHPADSFFNSEGTYQNFEKYEKTVVQKFNDFFTDELWKI